MFDHDTLWLASRAGGEDNIGKAGGGRVTPHGGRKFLVWMAKASRNGQNLDVWEMKVRGGDVGTEQDQLEFWNSREYGLDPGGRCMHVEREISEVGLEDGKKSHNSLARSRC
jgi:hypothetical protein